MCNRDPSIHFLIMYSCGCIWVPNIHINMSLSHLMCALWTNCSTVFLRSFGRRLKWCIDQPYVSAWDENSSNSIDHTSYEWCCSIFVYFRNKSLLFFFFRSALTCAQVNSMDDTISVSSSSLFALCLDFVNVLAFWCNKTRQMERMAQKNPSRRKNQGRKKREH